MEGLFFDTDTLLYAYDATAAARQKAVRWTLESAMDSGGFVTSTQVMHEFYKLAVSGSLLTPAQALNVLRHLSQHRVVGVDAARVVRAAQLQQSAGLAIGYALIVQSALDAGCRVLYSGTLPHGLWFDDPLGHPALWVMDPTAAGAAHAVHEPRADYHVVGHTGAPEMERPARTEVPLLSAPR